MCCGAGRVLRHSAGLRRLSSEAEHYSLGRMALQGLSFKSPSRTKIILNISSPWGETNAAFSAGAKTGLQAAALLAASWHL